MSYAQAITMITGFLRRQLDDKMSVQVCFIDLKKRVRHWTMNFSWEHLKTRFSEEKTEDS